MSKLSKEEIAKILLLVTEAKKKAGDPVKSVLVVTEEGEEVIHLNEDKDSLPN